jgi:hypothetical protein
MAYPLEANISFVQLRLGKPLMVENIRSTAARRA